MVKRTHKKYDAAFKRSVIELADSTDRPDSALEEEFDLYDGAIRTWRRQLLTQKSEAFPGNGNLPASDSELHRLRRENEILRQEREILKKAVAIFSLPTKPGSGL
ncbi:MAG: transposase [Bacteroidia bacterium]|nr:transposase [Bacteroidia bacterium]MCZ7555786.1 transposase [Bacteroidia bacterium]MCZ7557815.1 transposase [Bacteroidia bacterium]MCZ7558237.1 transposase [Bacteroidia bacterium]